jgi:hypothetical protein
VVTQERIRSVAQASRLAEPAEQRSAVQHSGRNIVHARVQRIDKPAGAGPLERELSGKLVFGVPGVGGADCDRAI